MTDLSTAITIEPKFEPPRLRLAGQSDRRYAPRIAGTASYLACFRDERGESIGMTTVRIVNTSATGAGVICPCPVPAGTTFSLCAPKSPLTGRAGFVAWCRPGDQEGEFALGLHFVQAKAA